MKLTYEYLHEILAYDPLTGELRNKIDRGKAKAGFVHHIQNTTGSILIRLKGRLYVAHRVIWFMQTGEFPEVDIDHKDLDRTNNRWSNLRLAERWQNIANRPARNKLGIKGVKPSGKKFVANITVAGTSIHLGTYDTVEGAGQAYQEASEIAHGEFAYHY